ncbi:phenylacetate--CoA ligase family protein [Candidatus Omnitrophota bacterium]
MIWKNLYDKLPSHTSDSIRSLAKRGYGLFPLRVRWGSEFFKQLEFLEKSQWWSRQELENYQSEKLRHLIKHAYDNTSYYRRLFKENGLLPSDIKTIKDLAKIPILTKDIVREHLQELIATNIDRKTLVRFSTSGTTGKPLIFFSEKRLEFFNFGPYMWRQYIWGGQGFNDLKALLGSHTLKPNKEGAKKIISYNPARNQLILSSYDINRRNASLFAEALRKYKPKIIEAFPASLEALIGFFKEQGVEKPVQPKAIFTNSEVLYPWQRKLIGEYFDCELFDVYCLEERVVVAAECEKHTKHHIFSEYGIVELVENGYPVEEGKPGEIIATSLNNYGMPFIRYNTKDIGYFVKENCPCGRGLPLLGLVGGRKRNFVVSQSGSVISITIVDIPNATDNVKQFQFVQKEQGQLELKIVRKNDFSQIDLRKIEKKLKEKFLDDMEVEICFVDSITMTQSGKQPLLIQRMDTDGTNR